MTHLRIMNAGIRITDSGCAYDTYTSFKPCAFTHSDCLYRTERKDWS